MDLPHITLPTPLYNAILCSLIVMASWHLVAVADGVFRHFRRRAGSNSRRDT